MIDNWRGLYRKGWNGNLIPEAFSHPAKVSFGLAEKIYQHMTEEGWLEPGAVVVDPFGGIAGCAFHAMKHGCNWIGCELEEKFVTLGNQNIDLWMQRYSVMPGWGTARLVQGDSRYLLEVIAEAGAAVSSPPFEDSLSNQQKDDKFWSERERRWGSRVASPRRKEIDTTDYGSTPGNLGNMRGTPQGLSAAVSSPPYAELGTRADGESTNSSGQRHGKYSQTENASAANGIGYGVTPGQLGAMPARGFEASVSSPPYSDSQVNPGNVGNQIRKRWMQGGSITDHNDGYGDTIGNLGNSDDFWTAARIIVDQVYAALAPGGHAVWIVKHFVKNKQRVDFPGQWRQMCEAAGFTTLHEHHAWLVEDRGTQIDLDGNHHNKKVERKSFFRRLAENKGSPRIDWETVYCMVKEA